MSDVWSQYSVCVLVSNVSSGFNSPTTHRESERAVSCGVLGMSFSLSSCEKVALSVTESNENSTSNSKFGEY